MIPQGLHRRDPPRAGFPQTYSVARGRSQVYFLNMRCRKLVFVVSAVATVAIGIAVAAEQDPVPLFTSEDLDRMFGAAPAQPSDPVDKTGPADWRWVEEFLDRQYSRIDADRQFDLSSRALDISTAQPVEQPPRIYARSVAWGLGYPASTWWDVVRSKHASRTSGAACRQGDVGFLLARGSSRDRGIGTDHPHGRKPR